MTQIADGPPLVSIVVPHYNAPEHLKGLIGALEQQDYPNIELVIADDGSDDLRALETLAADARLAQVSVLRLDHGGPAAARNAGVLAAQSEYVAFTDSDCLPNPDWLSTLVQQLQFSDVVYGRVTTDSGYLFPLFAAPAGERFVSCNMAVRKQAFSYLGGFQKMFADPFREDTDFGFRAVRKVNAVACVPAAVVYHPLRKQNAKKLFTSGFWHYYDAALWARLGNSVLDDIGKGYTRPFPAIGFSLVGAALSLLILVLISLVIVGRGVDALLLIVGAAAALVTSTILATASDRDERSFAALGMNGLAALPYVGGWFLGRLLGSFKFRRLCL